jgi:hypothetical protein
MVLNFLNEIKTDSNQNFKTHHTQQITYLAHKNSFMWHLVNLIEDLTEKKILSEINQPLLNVSLLAAVSSSIMFFSNSISSWVGRESFSKTSAGLS